MLTDTRVSEGFQLRVSSSRNNRKTHNLSHACFFIFLGFDGALQILDKLSEIKFKLNVDVAVQQFNNIKDAF